MWKIVQDSTGYTSLRSWRDLVRECFCFGCEAMKASGSAMRGLVKSRVEIHSWLCRSRIPSRALPVRENGGSAAARPLTHPASYAG